MKVRPATGDGYQKKDNTDRRGKHTTPINARNIRAEAIRARIVRDEKVPDDSRASRQGRDEPEKPAPGGAHDKARGEKRADDVSDPQRGPQNALVLPTLLQRDDVRDDNHRQRRDTAARQAGHTAEHVEHGRVDRQTAEQIGQTEQDQGGGVDDLPAEDIGQSAVEHGEHGIGDQGRRASPRDGRLGMEVARNRGQSDADAILVGRRDEQRDGEARKHDYELAEREDVRLVMQGLFGLALAVHDCALVCGLQKRPSLSVQR